MVLVALGSYGFCVVASLLGSALLLVFLSNMLCLFLGIVV
ncbi:hypothetical protein ES708_19983 [subsurface metagenome]